MFERRPAEQARERISGARQRLTQLRRALETELQEARAYHSPDYTPEGLANRRQELADQVRAKYAPQLQQLQAQVSNDAETLTSWAEKHRPRLADDAVALQRAQIRWDGVRAQLDAGKPMRAILASADLDTVLAIAEWAPAWMEAQAYANRRHGEPPATVDTNALHSAITARLTEVASPDARWALTAQQEAQAASGGFTPLADHARSLLDPTAPPVDALQAAIASHYGAQDGRASLAALGDSDGGEAA